MDTDKVMTHQKEANNLESNNQKVSITDLQSKLLSFEAELKEYRDTLEDLQANICEAENQTNAAKRTEEALELENILTLSDDTPDKITGSASVDNQEKNTITIPTRSWWQVWPTAPNHPPPTSGAEGGAGTGKVLEGTPDDHHQLQDNMINDPETMLGPNQSVTHIELEARLKKLQDHIKVKNFDHLQEHIKENEVITEENLKIIEKNTDRLLDNLETRLGAKIKKQTTDLETRLGSKITNLEQNLSRIEDQFDTLKTEKDTALVVADNKLVEQTDNTDTLKHLLGHFASDPSPGGTQSVIGLLNSYQFIRKTSKSLLNNRFPQYSHEKDCQFCSIVNLRM